MPKRAHPFTLGARVDERSLAEVDAAARLKRINRSEYVRDAVLAQVKQDLRAWVEEA